MKKRKHDMHWQSLTLSRLQAEKAIKLCLENATSFVKDAEISWCNKKFDHIIIPIEFALEEIGKAKIICDKLKEGKDKITITEDDRFYDHETKLAKAAKLMEPSEYLNSPNPYKIDELYGSLSFGNYWEAYTYDITLNGHRIRLAHTFVDLDTNGEPILEKEFKGFEALLTNIPSIIRDYPRSFW